MRNLWGFFVSVCKKNDNNFGIVLIFYYFCMLKNNKTVKTIYYASNYRT